ncbi:aminoglycoside phosphotransferase [Nocardioides euryhalodurans]|uniref:Aminoglycoside phosphotransferase n=1 Tax=Nocardioides euryhalodurans TaxID=2518370 RepID=A0A4P7GI39_9ACTN|nr:aminoglycoside phosphotransferase [Nocardioides euryhalodurans]
MREHPPHVSDDDVRSLLWAHWLPDVEQVTHLPVGFGAWHWQAWAGGRPVLFVTLDQLGERHTHKSLEGAYGAASALAARGLEFVLPQRRTVLGQCTVALGDDRLSATPWLEGTSGDGSFRDEAHARATLDLLERLHAETGTPALPRWRPLVHPSFASRLDERTAQPWRSGPYAEEARSALRQRLSEIRQWTADYHRLAAATDPASWVPTHGEPHTRNQVMTQAGTYLVDWESLKLAPRERDLATLVEHGWGDLVPAADPALLAMFDLEWRLDEIAQYAAWFEAEHSGSESDRVALAGLRHELLREPRNTARCA